MIAKWLGLGVSHESTLWRERALMKLNRTVLESFRQEGVTISDHHNESRRFLRHLEREEAEGRKCLVDWSWIVPPMSGAQTPVFHCYCDDEPQRPEFRTDDDAVRRALRDGPTYFPCPTSTS